jgi:O-antigen/teichoic acid export membrane protein
MSVAACPEQVTVLRGRELGSTISKNTLFGVLANVVRVGTRFVTIPIVIYHLGLDGYGIWAIIMTITSYMRFGTAGAKSAFQKYVAEATGNGDYEHANRLVSTGMALMLAISLGGLIPTSIFSMEVARLAAIPPQFLTAAARSISILAVILALTNAAAAYEGIVMGGHRIDITRRLSMGFSVAEMIGIILFLRDGYGLVAMAAIIAFSELLYLGCCYAASKRVVPQIQIAWRYVSPKVLKELVTYAGSYQLLNTLELVYMGMVPLAIMRYAGANAAGVYALATRLVTAALMPQDALMLPILSGSSMVHASGSAEQMRTLLRHSFKWTFAVTVIPLAFLATNGGAIVFAWTGESGRVFETTLQLVCLANLFMAVSLLQIILYRSAGGAVLDNMRQLLRICIVGAFFLSAKHLGFYGILAGVAVAEFAGASFMSFVMKRTFPQFSIMALLSDSMKLSVAAAIVLAIGVLVRLVNAPQINPRIFAVAETGMALILTLIFAGAFLLWSHTVSKDEANVMLNIFRKRRYA